MKQTSSISSSMHRNLSPFFPFNGKEGIIIHIKYEVENWIKIVKAFLTSEGH